MLGFDQSKLVYHYFNMQYIKLEIQGGTFLISNILALPGRHLATNVSIAKRKNVRMFDCHIARLVDGPIYKMTYK